MPSQIGGRCRFSAAANVQSSISAPRIAAKPPICRNASVRTSMQPPAAAAVAFVASLLQANGYSSLKKNTNAGDSSRSQNVSQWSSAISETSVASRSRSCASNAGTRPRRELDVGVEQQHVRPVDDGQALLERPQLAGPAVGQRPALDDAQRETRPRRARGGAARVVARLIVDDDDVEPAALAAERRDRAADQLPPRRAPG